MAAVKQGVRPDTTGAAAPSGPLDDLVLTLPMFVGYHLGVIVLPVRNAADVVTRELVALADHNMAAYGGVTLAIGLVYVLILGLAGRGNALRWQRFAQMAAEGAAYAIAMRLLAGYVVGRAFLAPPGAELVATPFAGFVMSLGAGFYEEIAFRVLLFGVGYKTGVLLFALSSRFTRRLVGLLWAFVSAAVFSGWHYFGALGEPFEPKSFLFRWVCGVVFTAIYAFRGFAPAVWTHSLYDIWVLVF